MAIARALVNRPSILLADEPTGNLDSRTSVEIMQILQDLNDKGLTIVLVAHEHNIAQFAKRVLVFRDGRIRKDDPVPNRPRASQILQTLPDSVYFRSSRAWCRRGFDRASERSEDRDECQRTNAS